MIELEKLTKPERIKISVQCEPKFFVANKQKRFKPLFDKIKEECFGSVRKYDDEIWLVITCLLKAIRYGNKGTRFSMNNNMYSLANKRHGQKLSCKRASVVIDKMDQQGWINVYKGYYRSKDDNMMSCVFYTDKFYNNLNTEAVKRYAQKRSPDEYVEIRPRKGEDPVVVSLSSFRGFSSITKSVEDFNNVLANSVIDMVIPDLNERVVCSVMYKRVFSGSLNEAGRYYAVGVFQTQKSESRKSIRVNKEFVTEVDYCNLHPRLLYTLEGIELPYNWDAYRVEGIEWVCSDSKLLRKAVKQFYMSVLFSDTEDEAVKSIISESNKLAHIKVKGKRDAKKVLQAIKDKNSEIKHWFFQERLWAKLQYMDGRLATHVINHFTSIKEVCLGWHDSFCVRKSLREQLKLAMLNAWRSLFGTDMNFKVETEF